MTRYQTPPLVTLSITTYNHERYVAEAVRSALAQTYSPLEIIISDDCSPDRTFAVASQIVNAYEGPHKIILNRNEKNIGLIAHVNKVFELAHGELILGSSGDDISMPSRTQLMVELYLRNSRRAILIHGDVQCIDQNGRQLAIKKPPIGIKSASLLDLAISEGIYIGASSAFSRALVDRFPPIQHLHAWEDLVWGFRAALLDGLVYYSNPVVLYRIEGGISAQMAYQNSFVDLLKANRKRRLIQLDVLKQRLEDAQSMKADTAVMQVLDKRVTLETIRGALMNAPTTTLVENACRQPTMLLSALALESLAWTRSLARNIKRLLPLDRR